MALNRAVANGDGAFGKLPDRAAVASGVEGAPAVEATDVARKFGRRWVLRGVSLTVQRGEAIALLGKNGSGKTTLLRILATLLRPTKGKARIYGYDTIKEGGSVREMIGLLGHMPGLYEDLTAAENLRFAYRMHGVTPGAGALQRLLEEVGLGHDADHRVRGFSAGMRRRLALARILIRPPALLMLDEPYAAFDVEGIDKINRLVLQMRELGNAVIVSTHDLPRALPVVNRVVRIEAGKLLEVDEQGAPRPTALAD